MKTPAHIKIAAVAVLLAVAAQAQAPQPPEKRSWKSGAATVTLSDDGTLLRVSGKGAMKDYHYSHEPPHNDPPWRRYVRSLAGARISKLIIEEGVTHIGDCAFAELDGLKSASIPNSVTSIGSQAFHECVNLASVAIPSRVTSIGSGAFQHCAGLTSVTVPGGEIGTRAFGGCTGLTSVTIEDGVTSIGHFAFYECINLTSITIPGSVENIGGWAFLGCVGLTSITGLNPVPPGIERGAIGRRTFGRLPSNACLYVPDSSINAYRAAYVWNDFKCIKPLESAPVTIKTPSEAVTVGKKQAQVADSQKAAANTFVDSRDGQVYRTVKIGNRTWMAENLNFKTGNSRCYDDDESNCQKYGRLYGWKTAMGVCPSGWRLPDTADWDKLLRIAGGDTTAIGRLKSKTGWDQNGNGTDDFGFSALPGGRYIYGLHNNPFVGAGAIGYWWSAPECHFYSSRDYYAGMDLTSVEKSTLFSVRCVRK